MVKCHCVTSRQLQWSAKGVEDVRETSPGSGQVNPNPRSTSHAKTQPEAGSSPNNYDPDSHSFTVHQDLIAPKMQTMTEGQIPRRGILVQQISQEKTEPQSHQLLALNKTPTMSKSCAP